MPKSKDEGWDERYGGLDLGGAVVLDIGAGDGLRAKWALLRGASSVFASEPSGSASFPELLNYAENEDRLTIADPLHPKTAANLLLRHRPDVVMCDCWGSEQSFLGVSDELMKGPKAWAMTTHSPEFYAVFSKWFRTLGYEVEMAGGNAPRPITAVRREVWVPGKIEDFVSILEAGTPFSYSNIGGDGEFLTILGWPGTNSDFKKSTIEKAVALAAVLLEPRLSLHGYNPGRAQSKKRLDAEKWLRRHGINVPELTHADLLDPDFGSSRINVRWVHKEIIASSNGKGRLAPFLRVLKARPLLVVGSAGIESFVERMDGESVLLPAEKGWDEMFQIEEEVRRKLLDMPDDTIVTWGLGYLSKILEWRLAPEFPLATQIDVGACWDPYCGTLNRHAYKDPGWPEMMEKNLSLLGETT